MNLNSCTNDGMTQLIGLLKERMHETGLKKRSEELKEKAPKDQRKKKS